MRTIRLNTPGVVYHLIWRFVDQRYFIETWRERQLYLRLLGKAFARSDWRCFGYAIMSNHIHVAALAGRQSMSSWTRRVNSPFAAYMNQRVQRIGPVFSQGAKDFAVSPAREAKLLAYIHRNPVRAGLVKRALQSTWTSHQAFVGRCAAPSWLHVDEALSRIGISAEEFNEWVNGEEGESCEVETKRIDIKLRRQGALRAATPTSPSIPVVARASGYWRPDPRLLVRIGCEVAAIPIELVCSKRHLPEAIATRRAIAIASAERGLSYSEIGDALGISQQAISKMVTRTPTVEELRRVGVIRDRVALEEGCESRVRPIRRL